MDTDSMVVPFLRLYGVKLEKRLTQGPWGDFCNPSGKYYDPDPEVSG